MSSTGLRCLHRIESKKPAIRKLTSTRSDVNRIQRRGKCQFLQNAGSAQQLLQVDEFVVAAADLFSTLAVHLGILAAILLHDRRVRGIAAAFIRVYGVPEIKNGDLQCGSPSGEAAEGGFAAVACLISTSPSGRSNRNTPDTDTVRRGTHNTRTAVADMAGPGAAEAVRASSVRNPEA
jgi:hypothetical protein